MGTEETVRITGGEAIARMIAAHNPGPMFGMGSWQLLPYYDAARRLGLSHHLINDERAGTFAAEAYAKATGRVGLADAGLGPGATNLVTALIESLNGGTPLVVVVGDTPRDHAWKNLTQEARQADILRPAVKELIEVYTPQRIPELVRRAFAVATSGRPGPVVLNVPENVSHAECEFAVSEFAGDERYEAAPSIRSCPDRESLTLAADTVAAAERPVIMTGGGIHLSSAYDELKRFSHALNIPVTHTITGTGSIPTDDPLCLGVFGRFDRIANDYIEQSDLLIVVGCKIGEVATKRFTVIPNTARIMHVDILPEEFGRTHNTEFPLCGDARETLAALSEVLADRAPEINEKNRSYAETVAARMRTWREEVVPLMTSDAQPISMPRLINEINATLPSDGILVADGGFAAHWGALLFDSKAAGRTFLPDRGFASIGYGMPGAIGSAFSGRPVVSLTGDGGFNMMIGELETALRIGLSPTIVVVNNAASGYVKALQHLMYGEGSYQASDLKEIDYAAVADAMGARGIRIEDPAELNPRLSEAIASDELTVLDVIVTRDPGNMLPAADPRTVKVVKGDRLM
jgi:acetolactate synthase-1/2/3 large subunit